MRGLDPGRDPAGLCVLVPQGPWEPRKLTDPAGGTTVPRGTHAGPGLRVAPLSEATVACLGAVGTKRPWGTAWERAREAGRSEVARTAQFPP